MSRDRASTGSPRYSKYIVNIIIYHSNTITGFFNARFNVNIRPFILLRAFDVRFVFVVNWALQSSSFCFGKRTTPFNIILSKNFQGLPAPTQLTKWPRSDRYLYYVQAWGWMFNKNLVYICKCVAVVLFVSYAARRQAGQQSVFFICDEVLLCNMSLNDHQL